MITVAHHQVRLAVHELTAGRGGAILLCLHGLGAQSPSVAAPELATWPGRLMALDFTGHGASSVPVGGGYTAEALMADVDAVCAMLGPVTLFGRGLGAYVATLFAGARPELVVAAILADGPGLSGGGPAAEVRIAAPPASPRRAPDPLALAELSGERRDPAYACALAREYLLATGPADAVPRMLVAATARPPWLQALLDDGLAVAGPIQPALAQAAGFAAPTHRRPHV